jgi:hypothetical protein
MRGTKRRRGADPDEKEEKKPPPPRLSAQAESFHSVKVGLERQLDTEHPFGAFLLLHLTRLSRLVTSLGFETSYVLARYAARPEAVDRMSLQTLIENVFRLLRSDEKQFTKLRAAAPAAYAKYRAECTEWSARNGAPKADDDEKSASSEAKSAKKPRKPPAAIPPLLVEAVGEVRACRPQKFAYESLTHCTNALKELRMTFHTACRNYAASQYRAIILRHVRAYVDRQHAAKTVHARRAISFRLVDELFQLQPNVKCDIAEDVKRVAMTDADRAWLTPLQRLVPESWTRIAFPVLQSRLENKQDEWWDLLPLLHALQKETEEASETKDVKEARKARRRKAKTAKDAREAKKREAKKRKKAKKALKRNAKKGKKARRARKRYVKKSNDATDAKGVEAKIPAKVGVFAEAKTPIPAQSVEVKEAKESKRPAKAKVKEAKESKPRTKAGEAKEAKGEKGAKLPPRLRMFSLFPCFSRKPHHATLSHSGFEEAHFLFLKERKKEARDLETDLRAALRIPAPKPLPRLVRSDGVSCVLCFVDSKDRLPADTHMPGPGRQPKDTRATFDAKWKQMHARLEVRMPKIAPGPDRTVRVIGVDPGVNSVWTAASATFPADAKDDEKIVHTLRAGRETMTVTRLTNLHWQADLGTRRHATKLQKLLADRGYEPGKLDEERDCSNRDDAEDEDGNLSACVAMKTANRDAFVVKMRRELATLPLALQAYFESPWRVMKLCRYKKMERLAHKHVQRMLNTDQETKMMPTIVAYGDGSFDSNMKGHCPAPVRRFRTHLVRLARDPSVPLVVLHMSEHRTSKLCSACHKEMESWTLRGENRARADETRRRHIEHSVRQCSCGRVWNRDINAARNMAYHAVRLLCRGAGACPPAFRPS